LQPTCAPTRVECESSPVEIAIAKKDAKERKEVFVIMAVNVSKEFL
jgi:hypothetical protein